MKKLQFPKGFSWGVSTSSYQIEGGTPPCDWQQWERLGKTEGGECGKACDYWNRWKSDHEMLVELGVSAFRLSIEWARIEPEEGVFSDEAISKYREILSDLKAKNIKTHVTLWHWVSPIWFSEKYGFHKNKSVDKFAAYSKKIIDELGDLVDTWVVFNEPMVPLGMGYLTGGFPPGFKNPWKFWKALRNLGKSHRKTYDAVHEKFPKAMVGITCLYNWYEVDGLGFIEKIADRIARWYRIDLLGNMIKNHQDYVGIDYYRLGKIVFDPRNSMHLGFRIEEDSRNIMRWVTYVKGMGLVLEEAYAKYKKPIYIMENGIPTDMGHLDDERIDFIKNHLAEVHGAIEKGIPVLGYNYWALMDNFEWQAGYAPKFGLVEVDFETLERRPRKSFYEYAKICKNNELEIEE